MVDAINQIVGYIQYAWDFFLNSLNALLSAILLMNQSLSFVTTISSMMPTIIGTAVTIFVAIFVIRFLALK